MLKKDIVAFHNALTKINLSGVKFAYAVAKNLQNMKVEIDALQKSLESSDEYKKYDEERIAVGEKWALKDEAGKAKTRPVNPMDPLGASEYVFTDGEHNNRPQFDKDIKELQKKYKKAIDERAKQIKDYTKLLEEEVAFIPYKIAIEEVPEGITTKQMNDIIVMIAE